MCTLYHTMQEPFWMVRLMVSFDSIYFSRRPGMMRLKSFPMIEVRAMGLNGLGSVVGSALYTRVIPNAPRSRADMFPNQDFREQYGKKW